MLFFLKMKAVSHNKWYSFLLPTSACMLSRNATTVKLVLLLSLQCPWQSAWWISKRVLLLYRLGASFFIIRTDYSALLFTIPCIQNWSFNVTILKQYIKKEKKKKKENKGGMDSRSFKLVDFELSGWDCSYMSLENLGGCWVFCVFFNEAANLLAQILCI